MKGLLLWLTLSLSTASAERPTGSPLPEELRMPVRVVRYLSMPDDDPMHMPTDVAVNSRLEVIVADGANDRIVWFDAAGKVQRIIKQVKDGALQRPVGVAVDEADNLWIADSANHRVVVLDKQGSFQQTIALPGHDSGPAEPTDVALLDRENAAVIVDNQNHRLLIYDQKTRDLTSHGRFGRSLGRFRWPFMVAVTGNGDICVTDVIGARVQRMTAERRWISPIDRWGLEAGELYRPKGIATDAENRLLVSDSTTGVVQAFDWLGKHQGVLTDSSGVPMHFKHPMGMCVDSKEMLYVVELRADRVAMISFGDSARRSPATQPVEQTEDDREP